METDGIGEIKDAFDEVNASLSELVEDGVINEAQKGHLLDWAKRVLDKLTVNYENVKKEVDDFMGGYILHTRTDDILDQGRDEGRKEERREKIEAMLRKGKTPEEIVEFCDYPMALVLDVQQGMLVMA